MAITDMARRAGSRPTEPAVPHEAMAGAGAARMLNWWRWVWQRLMPAPGAERVALLNRQLAVLEGARTELEAGWVQGGWWAVTSGDGVPRLAGGHAAACGNPERVEGVCLVGALVRAGSRQSGSAPDVGRAAEAVYDALWSSLGQPDAPRPGGPPPVPPPEIRLARVRTLTQWNDEAGRTQAEVLGVVDRAISATIMELISVPRLAQAKAATASAVGTP